MIDQRQMSAVIAYRGAVKLSRGIGAFETANFDVEILRNWFDPQDPAMVWIRVSLMTTLGGEFVTLVRNLAKPQRGKVWSAGFFTYAEIERSYRSEKLPGLSIGLRVIRN